MRQDEIVGARDLDQEERLLVDVEERRLHGRVERGQQDLVARVVEFHFDEIDVGVVGACDAAVVGSTRFVLGIGHVEREQETIRVGVAQVVDRGHAQHRVLFDVIHRNSQEFL